MVVVQAIIRLIGLGVSEIPLIFNFFITYVWSMEVVFKLIMI